METDIWAHVALSPLRSQRPHWCLPWTARPLSPTATANAYETMHPVGGCRASLTDRLRPVVLDHRRLVLATRRDMRIEDIQSRDTRLSHLGQKVLEWSLLSAGRLVPGVGKGGWDDVFVLRGHVTRAKRKRGGQGCGREGTRRCK